MYPAVVEALAPAMNQPEPDAVPIPKFEKMKRVSARSSWMITQQMLPRVSFTPKETLGQPMNDQE